LCATPEAATVRDGSSRLLLHIAIESRASRSILEIESRASLSVLEVLLRAKLEAATVRDGSGRLPLHIAIESRASLSVLEVLLHANPDTGEAVCRRRDDVMLNFPPVLMAAASDYDLESIFTLLHYDPTITKRRVTFVSRKCKSPPA
jgi:hypothetical protein